MDCLKANKPDARDDAKVTGQMAHGEEMGGLNGAEADWGWKLRLSMWKNNLLPKMSSDVMIPISFTWKSYCEFLWIVIQQLI